MRSCRKADKNSTWHKAHYEAADVNDKIIINLRDLSHVMRSLYEGRGSQKRILIVLDEINSQITQRELTERLGIQPGSASEVIVKLESAGYIKRTPSETDRRTADIELTEAGRAVASETREQRIRRHEEMFSCLSEEEKTELLFLLEKVSRDWERRYQDIEENCERGEPDAKTHKRHGNMHRQRRE